MPTDHEEAVREAREALLAEANEAEGLGDWAVVRKFEAAIRASERAKYAALVEAAVEVVRVATPEHFETNRSVSALHRALDALQSKEGTNE